MHNCFQFAQSRHYIRKTVICRVPFSGTTNFDIVCTALTYTMAAQQENTEQALIATTRAEAGIVKFLDNFTTSVQQVNSILPSVNDTIAEIEQAEQRIDELVKDVTALSDPNIAEDFVKIKQEFRACIRDGKSFLRACLAMARYATDEGCIGDIKSGLEMGSLDELKEYLEGICNLLEDSRECLKDFEESKETTDSVLQDRKKEYEMKASESAQDVTSLEKRHSDAYFTKYAINVVQKASAVLVSASMGAGCYELLSGRTSFILGGLGAAGLTLAKVLEAIPASDTLKQQKALEAIKKESKVFEDARGSITKLDISMRDVLSLIKDMCGHVKSVTRLIEGERGLKKMANVKPVDKNKRVPKFRLILNKLESLLIVMDEIKKALGQGGSKISVNPDELISNEQTQDTDDTTETDLSEAFRETLRFESSPHSLSHSASGGPPQVSQEYLSPPVTTAAVEEGEHVEPGPSRLV